MFWPIKSVSLSNTINKSFSFSFFKKKSDLVWHRKLREIRDVPGPLHGAEEQPGSQLADVVNPHGIIWTSLLVVLVSIPTAGIRLGSQQLGNELWHWLTSATASVVVVIELATEATGATYGRDGGTEARLRWDATALNCCSVVGGQRGGEETEGKWKKRNRKEEVKRGENGEQRRGLGGENGEEEKLKQFSLQFRSDYQHICSTWLGNRSLRFELKPTQTQKYHES